MPTSEQKLNKLKELHKLVSESLFREEFAAAFKNILKNILEQILKLEKDLIRKIDGKTDEAERKLAELEKECRETIKRIEEENKSSFYNMKRWAIQKAEELFVKSRINEKIKEIDERLANLRDGNDGKDADEESMLERLKAEIPKEETAEETRDKLESLQDEERLSISAINGLEEILDELKKNPVVYGGSGFNYNTLNMHILDPYTPTGTINGVNTDFVLSHTPSPTTSLKVLRGGQKQQLTTDYTLSGLTITFLIAPVVGEVIEVEHRI